MKEQLFVVQMHRRGLYVVRRQGKSGEMHGVVAERLRKAAACIRQPRIVFQPCNASMAISVLRSSVLRFELEYAGSSNLLLFFVYILQLSACGCQKAAICFPRIHGFLHVK
jgi:hypothetical protein